MPLIYGEGEENAFKRLKALIQEDRECIRHLRLTDPRDDKKRIEEIKGGLLEDSYHWILENSDFQQWRNDQQSGLLWIKGDPGKGKTMLLCGIVNELKKSKAETDLLSYFFFQATESRINNATAILRGLVYLLVDQQPSLISHIRKKHDHAGKTLFEDANACVALSEIFINILQDPSLNGTYLIIDALDECMADLPKLLDFIVQKSSVSPRVKWIVSSRNWPDIEERLESACHQVLAPKDGGCAEGAWRLCRRRSRLCQRRRRRQALETVEGSIYGSKQGLEAAARSRGGGGEVASRKTRWKRRAKGGGGEVG
jgi:hypothetical protein